MPKPVSLRHFTPKLGLTPEAVVQAALDGLHRGREQYGVACGLIICAMRHQTDSLEWAEMAIDFRHRGVVGFDLAGEEAGYPPKKHADAFHAIQRANFCSTLHAGEAFGVASIGRRCRSVEQTASDTPLS
jgi:adenosine deaminase